MSKEGQGNFGMLVRSQEDEGEDETTEDGVLFYVNKGGFPVDKFTWDRMWNHVAKLHPDGYDMVTKIKKKSPLPEVPIPIPPINFPSSATVDEKLFAVQKFMSFLQYNHTGTQFFEIKKNRPVCGLLDTAKDMIREALPIKCLEAVILAIFLTNSISGIDRFPLSFKTVFGGQTFRHVVLGVYHGGRYGALGMSRRNDLMYKPLEFKTLSSLMLDYKRAYERYFHTVKKMKVGLPVPHDPHSYEPIVWKKINLTVGNHTEEEMAKDLDRFARDMRTQKASLMMSELTSHRTASVIEANKNISHRKHRSGSKSKKQVTKKTSIPATKVMVNPMSEEEQDEDGVENEEVEATKKQPVINYQVRV